METIENSPIATRRSLAKTLAFGAALAIALVAAIVFAWSSRAASSRAIHVVNGHAAPIAVAIDALAPLALEPGARTEIALGEGAHRAKLSGAVELEEEFALEGSFPARLFDERIYVLNPGGAAILLRETTSYSGSVLEASAAPTLELSYGRTLATFEPVDHEFEPFPDRIEGAGGAEQMQRSRLSLFEGDPAELVGRLAASGRADDALELAEWALEHGHGERAAMLGAYTRAASGAGESERARRWLGPGLESRPLEIELHRQYQMLATSIEDQLNLVAEYDAMVAADPRNADLLYLRGRLEESCAAAEIWLDRAVAIDASHAFAQFSLACARASRGNWAGAVAPGRAATATPEGAARFRSFLDVARLSSHGFVELEAELGARISQAPGDVASWVMLGALLNLSGRSELALTLPAEFERALTEGLGAPLEQVQPAVRALRVDVLEGAGQLESALELADDPARRGRLLLELGRLDEAEELLGFEQDPAVPLALAVARAAAGDAERAASWRARAAESLAAGDAPMRLLARAIEHADEEILAQALDAFTRPDLKALALAALADLHPGRAKDLRSRALELQVLPAFPRRLLERAASNP